MYVNGWIFWNKSFFYTSSILVSLETNSDVKDDRTLFLIQAFESSILKEKRPTWIPLSNE